MSFKATLSIRELEAPTMGRALWVRSLNREIINNLPLRMKGDVINNKHPRYYNPTRANAQMLLTFLDSVPKRKEKTLPSTVLSTQHRGPRVTF